MIKLSNQLIFYLFQHIVSQSLSLFSFLTDLFLTVGLKLSKTSNGNDKSPEIVTLSGRRDKQLA